jgi:hypothetical protein
MGRNGISSDVRRNSITSTPAAVRFLMSLATTAFSPDGRVDT